MALSKRKIYGIITADITVNALMFQRFIEEMLAKRNEDQIVEFRLSLLCTTILSIMLNKFKHTSNLQKYYAWQSPNIDYD